MKNSRLKSMEKALKEEGLIADGSKNIQTKYEFILDYIPSSEWAAILAGTSTYDCSAAIVAASATNKPVWFHGDKNAVYKVNTRCTIASACVWESFPGVTIDVSAQTVEPYYAIRITGGVDSDTVNRAGLTDLPALASSIVVGDDSVSFATAHGLAVGDKFIIHNTTDSSWLSANPDYQLGDFVEVKRVLSATQVQTTRVNFAFASGNSNIKLLKYSNNLPVRIHNLNFRNTAPDLAKILQISQRINPVLDSVTAYSFTRNACISLDRCWMPKVIDCDIAQDYFVFYGDTTNGSNQITNVVLATDTPSSITLAQLNNAGGFSAIANHCGNGTKGFNFASVPFIQYTNATTVSCFTSTAFSTPMNANTTQTGVKFVVTTGYNYGIAIGNSYQTKIIRGNFRAGRHAVAIGGSDDLGCIQNMHTTIDGALLWSHKESRMVSADCHGNSAFTTYKNCVIHNGITIGGLNMKLDNNVVHSSYAGLCWSFTDFAGGDFVDTDSKYYLYADAHAMATRAPFDIGRNGGGIDVAFKQPNIKIQNPNIYIRYTATLPYLYSLYNYGWVGDINYSIKNPTIAYDGIAKYPVKLLEMDDTTSTCTGGIVEVSGVNGLCPSSFLGYHSNPADNFMTKLKHRFDAQSMVWNDAFASTQPLGTDLVGADSTFGTIGTWSLGTGWADGTGKALLTVAPGVGTLTHAITAAASTSYLVQWTQTSSVIGNASITPSIGAVSGTAVTNKGTDAVICSQVITTDGSGGASIVLTPTNITGTGTVTIDDVTVKPINASGWTGLVLHGNVYYPYKFPKAPTISVFVKNKSTDALGSGGANAAIGGVYTETGLYSSTATYARPFVRTTTGNWTSTAGFEVHINASLAE